MNESGKREAAFAGGGRPTGTPESIGFAAKGLVGFRYLACDARNANAVAMPRATPSGENLLAVMRSTANAADRGVRRRPRQRPRLYWWISSGVPSLSEASRQTYGGGCDAASQPTMVQHLLLLQELNYPLAG